MAVMILEKVRELYDQKLYSNVTCLANLLISLTDNNPELLPLNGRLQLLILYADSFYQQSEYRKAENLYQKALQMRKSLLKSKGKPQALPADFCSDTDIKYSIYLCHVNLKQIPQAIAILESIPGKQRTVRVNMALAKLYQQSGMERSAITGYKEVLKEYPLALDAALGLLSLGVKGVEVVGMTLTGTTGLPCMDWLSTWIRAYASLYAREYSQSLSCFEQLEARHLHNNVEVLRSVGEAHYYAGDFKQSSSALCRAQAIDPLLTKGMDIYAVLLAREKKMMELEKLALHLMQVNDQHAEPWIAFGAYVMCMKTSSKAAFYVHKACLINPRNVEAFLLKGNILVEGKQTVEAITAFREAMKISPCNFEAHQGLVKCHLELHRTKEALAIAGNACKLLGQTPRTLALYASVWAVDPSTLVKAEAYLDKALKIDPTNMDVIYQLAQLYEQERKYEQGIELLKKQVAVQSTSRLHQLLAEFYTCINDNEKAMEHFHAAMNFDGRNRKIMEGLQRAEQQMDARGATCTLDFDILPDSDNDGELDDSEVDGVWSDSDFPL